MSNNKTSYVYQVEFLIEDDHHASALAQLLSKLNTAEFLDYKILSGVQLGNEINHRSESASSITPVPFQSSTNNDHISSSIDSKKNDAKGKKTTSPKAQSNKETIKQDGSMTLGIELFQECKAKNKLIRLIINRGLGIKSSIPCRVINIDEHDLLITVYHVDEKQVYTFRMTEIEDFIES